MEEKSSLCSSVLEEKMSSAPVDETPSLYLYELEEEMSLALVKEMLSLCLSDLEEETSFSPVKDTPSFFFLLDLEEKRREEGTRQSIGLQKAQRERNKRKEEKIKREK